MQYLDIDFPDNLSYYFNKSIEFLTTTASIKNKSEICNQNWQHPRYTFTLVRNNLNQQDFALLQSFFLICKGKSTAFNFLDKTDYLLKQQQIGIGDGTTISFDIHKVYSCQNYAYARRIHKIKNAKVYLNNVLVDKQNYSIAGGTLTFNEDTIPQKGQAVFIDAEFATIVRFDNDLLQVVNKNHYAEAASLSLVETKVM